MGPQREQKSIRAILIVHGRLSAAHLWVAFVLRTWRACPLSWLPKGFYRRSQAMMLFFSGFLTGTLLTVYLFLGAHRSQCCDPKDAAAEQADRWKFQRPLPPF